MGPMAYGGRHLQYQWWRRSVAPDRWEAVRGDAGDSECGTAAWWSAQTTRTTWAAFDQRRSRP